MKVDEGGLPVRGRTPPDSRTNSGTRGAKEVSPMEDTGSTHHHRQRAVLTGGKWAAVRDAMATWGTTVRFCVIVVVINAPILLLLIIRR
jgi:hypothetical protein